MKKLIPIAIFAIVLIIGLCMLIPNNQADGYIRIHIRANSNNDCDQSIKYTVKTAVVECITPLAKDIDSVDKMYTVLEKNLDNIKACVDKTLTTNGYTYGSSIRLNKEEFPTRTYEELTLEAGVYDALIIELGSGSGDNWWCVAFPPLCFQQSGDQSAPPEYRWIFEEWWQNR